MTELKNLKYFLEIKIERFNKSMFLSQEVYIINLLKRLKMDECNPVKSETSDPAVYFVAELL